MHIQVRGAGPDALFLAGCCAAGGMRVSLNGGKPGRQRLRMVTCRGWLEVWVEGHQEEREEEPDLRVCTDDTLDPMVSDDEGIERVLVAGDFRSWHTGLVEETGAGGWLIGESRGFLQEIATTVPKGLLRVQRVAALEPSRAGLWISRLLWLPAAMCGTSVAGLLSTPEGREIATRVLEEGIRVFKRAGTVVGEIPWNDPGKLLRGMQTRPAAFDAGRHRPDRGHPPLADLIAAGNRKAAGSRQVRLGEIARAARAPADWTWRLLDRLGGVCRNGPFASARALLGEST